MVRGLTVGIVHSQVEGEIETTLEEYVKKEGKRPCVVVDGGALAFHVVEPGNREHSWDFVHGGDYVAYNERVVDFISLLRSFDVEITIVFPLADGIPPASEDQVERWNQKATEKLRRVLRVKTVLERNITSSRNLLEVLPPMILQEIIGCVSQLEKVTVVYTRNNIARFCANYVAQGKASAVIGQNSDYLIFPDVDYIPIDSIDKEDVNDEAGNKKTVLKFELLNRGVAAQKIGLDNQEKMFQLSVLLGNPMTEQFVVNKYNIPSMLHIKLNPKYPDALVNGIAQYLNGDEFVDIWTTAPTKEMIDGDESLKHAIEQSKAYFDLSVPLDDEGSGEYRELTEKGKLPLWAYGVSLGGDFWTDVVVDDYSHPVKTELLCLELRKLFYCILGRDSVIEHYPSGDKIVTTEVEAEKDFLRFADLKKFHANAKQQAKLPAMFRKIAHANFPNFNLKKDPAETITGPLFTVVMALRFLVSVCFTRNQADYAMLPEDAPEELKAAGVLSAPPLDMFEVEALALSAFALCSGLSRKFEPASFKPSLRRVKVSAMYQNVLMHLIWLQEFFGIKPAEVRPRYLFDGQVFAAAYDVHGELAGFSGYFSDPEAVMKEEAKFGFLMKAILAPFPAGLFDAFKHVPRSMSASAFEQSKPVTQEVIVHKSAFAALMDSDSEYDDDEGAPAAPPPVSVPPPPAPKAAPPPPKKQQKGKATEEEDDLEAFLLAQAAKNAQAGGNAPRPTTKAEPKKKPARKQVRRHDGGANANPQVFNRESKQELKRQLKQQIYDFN